MLAQLRQEFPNDLKIVFRHYPNTLHDKSLLAAQAAEAAGLQGKFWEMDSALLTGQGDWSALSILDFKVWLDKKATAIGLDPKIFDADLTSKEIVDKLEAAREKVIALGIPYTPFLIINGKIWQGPWDYYSFKDVVNLLLLEKRQFTGCPPFTIDITKQYIASIETEKGTITIQLYPDKAPFAVNSYVFLADNGYFDGITFHRVIKGYLAQSGDPSGTGYGGPGYAFVNEIDPNLKFDKPGVVGMANAGPDTNGSQFFITLTSMPNLDGDYTIFGQVIQGMEVARALTERDPSQGIPNFPGDKILHVSIEVR